MRRYLPYLTVLLVVLVVSATLIYLLVSRFMLAEAEKNIENLLLSQRSLHYYIQRVMHPEYFRALKDVRIDEDYYAPQILSSSYIVREMHAFYNEERQRRGLPTIYYKMAADNPRNPLNLADARESELLRYFNEHRDIKEYRAVVELDGKKYLFYAEPFLETNQACLRCHGRREDAPPGLQARYPGAGGFGDRVGNIRAIESIRAPIAEEMTGVYVVTGSLSAGVLSLCLLFVGNQRLSRRVRQRTEELHEEIAETARAEEELRQANEELEQAVLFSQTVAEEALQANRAKNEFLANMSHEIRTPLNGILGTLQLLETTRLDREQAGYVAMSEKCGENLLQLLSDILDLSAIEAGKLMLHQAPVDLVAEVKSDLAIFDAQLQAKQLRLDLQLAPAVPARVVTDATRVRQVLFNLVGNAIKFTPPGGTITVRLNVEAATRLLLEIADTGVGIEPKLLGKIFEPFTQGDASFQKQYQGAGLGLALVKRICEQMGGEVTIDSTVGKGTTVRVAIPVTVTAAAAGQAKSAPQMTFTAPAGPRNILLVEDNPINQKATRLLLERMGYRVCDAGDGEEALALLAREKVDLVFMDIQLPVMDGLEALRRIRAGGDGIPDPQVPVVAMTAYTMHGDREMFLAAGMDAYLAKPFRAEEMRSLIEGLVGKGAAQNRSL